MKIIIVDADALIALFNKDDLYADKAMAILETLERTSTRLIHPATAVVEAVTTLQRKLHRPDYAAQIAALIKEAKVFIEPIDQPILGQAVNLFNPAGSKQNTLFDAVVAAVAKKYKAEVIFSFDRWYRKLGFQLAEDIF